MNNQGVTEKLAEWAEHEPSVSALVAVGSQVHTNARGGLGHDEFSDWDFQVIADEEMLFADRRWIQKSHLGEAMAYVNRLGRLGSAKKVSIVLAPGIVDLVILPTRQVRIARNLLDRRIAHHAKHIWEGLNDLAVVINAGYRFLKGETEWGLFYSNLAAVRNPNRLDDSAILNIAEGFVCDYISIVNKVKRGELLAAQRGLHLHLAEVNFSLFHEWRQRCGEVSFPDGRRLEFLGIELETVTVASLPSEDQLFYAVERCAANFRIVINNLVGAAWRWPLRL